jgi:hypothetical protein
MVFVLAMIGVMVVTLIAFTFGKEYRKKIALLIPVVIVVGFFAIYAMGVLAGGRAARLAELLELPNAELKIETVTVQSQRYVSIRSQVVPANKVMLSWMKSHRSSQFTNGFIPNGQPSTG